MGEFKYGGSELGLFAAMENWKTYLSRQIRPFLRGDILEVGAGIGSNIRFLEDGGNGRWVCLEPDADLHRQLLKNIAEADSRRKYDAICGTLATLAGQQFDTIIYIEVLEHIANDREELNEAASHLRNGGRLIVVAPAHQLLFSAFDVAIGHFRRYNRAMVRNLTPASLQLEQIKYLDCVGMILSAANAFILRQSMPTKAQLGFWDGWMVPLSRLFDRLFLYSVGKTIIAIWRKEALV
jgi:SAM-dependent methyltransferase